VQKANFGMIFLGFPAASWAQFGVEIAASDGISIFLELYKVTK